MLKRAEVVRFDQEIRYGRNRPVLVGVETECGDQRDVFVKLSARCELGIEALANEAIAAMLAGDLGLPLTEPLLVKIDGDWLEALPAEHAELKQDVLASSPLAFGSTYAGPQWVGWTADDIVPKCLRQTALEILAFDAFVENDDRRSDNPNLLRRGDELRIIDHELAFILRTKLFPPPHPWVTGNLDRLARPGGHIFMRSLKGKPDLSYEGIRAGWNALSDARFAQYEDALPDEWDSVRDPMEAALIHVQHIRDRIDLCVDELDRVLS